MPQSTILEIDTGRVASVRVAPNEDLVESLDQAAAHLGFRRALVRSGLGSLIDATFEGAKVLRTGSRGPPSSFCPCPARFRSTKVALNRPASPVLSVIPPARSGLVDSCVG